MTYAAFFSDLHCSATLTAPTEPGPESLNSFCYQLMERYKDSLCEVAEIYAQQPSFELGLQCNSSLFIPLVIQTNQTNCLRKLDALLCLDQATGESRQRVFIAMTVSAVIAFMCVGSLLICAYFRKYYFQRRQPHPEPIIVQLYPRIYQPAVIVNDNPNHQAILEVAPAA